MDDRKPPKTQAERARDYRRRQRGGPVENPVTRDELRDELRDVLVTIRDEIVTLIDVKMSEIVLVLRESSPLGPPLEGSLRGESSLPEKTVTRTPSRESSQEPSRVWTNSFTTRPGEIPRCPTCQHLMTNCQCEWEGQKAERRERERSDLA